MTNLSLIHDYSYSGTVAANATPGSNAVGTNQIDTHGSVASIASSRLTLATQGTNPEFTNFLYFNDITAQAGQRQVLTFDSANVGVTAAFRFNSTNLTCYYFECLAGGAFQFRAFKTSGAPASVVTALTASGGTVPSYNSSHVYQLVAEMLYGNNFISWALYDITVNGGDPQTISDPNSISTGTFTDTASLYSSGLMCLNVGSSTKKYKRIRIYGSSISPAQGQISTTTNYTMTGIGTTWLTVPPVLSAALGTINGTPTVNSNTSVTFNYTTPGSPNTDTITDSVSGTVGTIEAVVGSALVTNLINPTGASNTSNSFSLPSVAGGKSPYSYQWYRSTTPNYTPGAGNILTGKTASTMTDTTMTAGTDYYFKCVVTDSASTVATSVSCGGRLYDQPAIVLGAIGDSEFARTNNGISTIAQLAQLLQQYNGSRSVTIINQAVSGTATSDWGLASSNYTTAKAAFIGGGVTTCLLMLGTNDCIISNSTATVKANILAIINDLATVGINTILFSPPYWQPGAAYAPTTRTDAALAQMIDYRANAYPPLINGTTVFAGDTALYNYVINHESILGDGLHPGSATGDITFASYWLEPVAKALGFGISGGGGSTGGGINPDPFWGQ